MTPHVLRRHAHPGLPELPDASGRQRRRHLRDHRQRGRAGHGQPGWRKRRRHVQLPGWAELVGSLDGGGGFDTLSYAAFGGSVSVQITGSDAGGYSGTEGQTFSGGGFQGIDNIIASPSAAGSSILTGDDLTSTWDLGTTQTYSDGSATPLSFSGFALSRPARGPTHSTSSPAAPSTSTAEREMTVSSFPTARCSMARLTGKAE